MPYRYLGLAMLLSACAPKVSVPTADAPLTVPAGHVVTLGDGAANIWSISLPEGAPATWSYEPMTPERSSTGSYSGGKPGNGVLTEEHVKALWARLETIEADKANHVVDRAKGTWFVTVTGPKAIDLITNTSPATDELVLFLQTIHTP